RYFAIVKALGEDAIRRGDLDAAAANYHLYTEYDRSGVETLRTLADLHEKRGDALAAVRVVEKARLYNPNDPDLLERRDRYYFSVRPENLRTASESLQRPIDADYCLTKAKQLLDLRNADHELIDWAQHLLELALARKPESITARTFLARARLRLGDR